MTEKTETLAVFSQRWAAKRLRGVIDKKMNDKKREIIARSAFKELLNISPFAAPMELIEFVVMNTDAKLREFRYKKKEAIVFTRHMVKKVLGVPSSHKPLDMLKRGQNCELRDEYRNEKGRPTIAKVVSVLENCPDDDEAAVVRNFGLIAFATVLCPGTGNMTNLDLLGSLMDKDSIDQYAIDEHILNEDMKEVEVFQLKMEKRRFLDATKDYWIGQCLPMLAIIYMDFLSFPPLPPNVHRIQYNTPRVCFVCDEDFELVVEVDKNKLCLSPTAFGKRPILTLAETIYVDPALAPPPNVDAGSQDAEVNPSASLNEWLEKGLPSNQELQSELIKDPAKFETSSCIGEFKSACIKYNLVKSDLLHFPIVLEKHWITVCFNVLHKEVNVFDSLKSSKVNSSVVKVVDNLIANFRTLAREAGTFSIDIATYRRGGPSDYPQQSTLYDCGFFVMLYIENFDGRVMATFERNSILAYRKVLAAGFINHTINTEDSAAVFEDEIE